MIARSFASFDPWLAALERRHLSDLTFQEVRRALQALSSTYVERRRRLGDGAVLDGDGKRAAFALFYGPLHLVTIRRVVERLGAAEPPPRSIVDLGCGTGVAGAAWASVADYRPRVLGVDLHPWAVREASWTYRRLGVRGRALRMHVGRVELPGEGDAVIAGFVVNELADADRRRLLDRLLRAARAGARVLVVEPIAIRPVPWWSGWTDAFRAAGGRADTWRFREELPDLVHRLDRAAGLDHTELTARTLWLPGGREDR